MATARSNRCLAMRRVALSLENHSRHGERPHGFRLPLGQYESNFASGLVELPLPQVHLTQHRVGRQQRRGGLDASPQHPLGGVQVVHRGIRARREQKQLGAWCSAQQLVPRCASWPTRNPSADVESYQACSALRSIDRRRTGRARTTRARRTRLIPLAGQHAVLHMHSCVLRVRVSAATESHARPGELLADDQAANQRQSDLEALRLVLDRGFCAGEGILRTRGDQLEPR